MFTIFADHHQFCLFDDDVCPPFPEDITELDLQRRFKAAPNLVAVYTDEESEFEVAIEFSGSTPPIEYSAWAHIVEGPLNLPSGRVVLASPSSHLISCPRVEVLPGQYRVRVSAPIPAGGTHNRYLVNLWPSQDASIAVLKSAGQYAA